MLSLKVHSVCAQVLIEFSPWDLSLQTVDRHFFYCRMELAAAQKQAANNVSEWEAEFNVHHHHVQQNILPQQGDISGERITLNQQNNLK